MPNSGTIPVDPALDLITEFSMYPFNQNNFDMLTSAGDFFINEMKEVFEIAVNRNLFEGCNDQYVFLSYLIGTEDALDQLTMEQKEAVVKHIVAKLSANPSYSSIAYVIGMFKNHFDKYGTSNQAVLYCWQTIIRSVLKINPSHYKNGSQLVIRQILFFLEITLTKPLHETFYVLFLDAIDRLWLREDLPVNKTDVASYLLLLKEARDKSVFEGRQEAYLILFKKIISLMPLTKN